MLITYTSDDGQEVRFSNDSALELTNILLTDADGIHGLPAEVHVLTQYGQDGATYVDSQLPPRTVRLNGVIARDIVATRMAMLEAMNPLVEGTLMLQRGRLKRKLRVVVEQAPSFSSKNGRVFSVIFTAPNPYWQEEYEQQHDVAIWEPVFEWPLDIPEEGVSFGERSASLVTAVMNRGVATCGMRVVMSAMNDVRNPEISHVVTYKRMRMLLEMAPGDVVTITTGYGEKACTLRRAATGVEENAMHLLDVSSELFEFLQLEPGENLLRYDAEFGVENLIISVYYSPGYLGV